MRAKEERREILEYWVERTGDKIYSRKLAKAFREKIKFIAINNYAGTSTDIENVRVTVCGKIVGPTYRNGNQRHKYL